MEFENESASSFSVAKMRLDCRCALSSAIIKNYVGPEIICDSTCQVSTEATLSCGGKHQFSDGSSETFYSAYCLNNVTIIAPTTMHPTINPTPTSTGSSIMILPQHQIPQQQLNHHYHRRR